MFVHCMVSCVLVLSDSQASYIMLGPPVLQRESSIGRESLALIWPKTVPRCPVTFQVCEEFGHEVTKLHQDMLQRSYNGLLCCCYFMGWLPETIEIF